MYWIVLNSINKLALLLLFLKYSREEYLLYVCLKMSIHT